MSESAFKNTSIEELAPVNYRIHPLLEALLVGAAILIATLSSSYFIYLRALHAQEGEIRQGLLRTARVAATVIDPLVHQSFSGPQDEPAAPYQAALAPLVAMKNSDPQIAYLYTAVLRGGKVYFIFDVTPTPANACPLDAQGESIESEQCETDTSVGVMQQYDDAPENLAMMQAFKTQEPGTSVEAYTDQYGTFISGFVPLLDAQGKFYGLLGMDIDIKDYNARLAPIKRATTRALVTGFFIAFLMASSIWFLRNFILVLNDRRAALYFLARWDGARK